jgi:hypothetical protein
MKQLPDLIPLGVSGSVTVPKHMLFAAMRTAARQPQFLLTENERLDWLKGRLDRQVDRPLPSGGSGVMARKILDHFPSETLMEFARKLLLTLRDGEPHNNFAAKRGGKLIGVGFVAWRGSWQDVASRRYGLYLVAMLDAVRCVCQQFGSMAGYLQIDAFIQENIDRQDPLRTLEASIVLDVEFTYLPGGFLSNDPIRDPDLPNLLVVNRDLCTREQLAMLGGLD